MKRKQVVVLIGLVFCVLMSALPASATSITAHVTGRALGFFFPDPPPIQADLDVIVTMEQHPGPFWWPTLQTFLADQNGYVITSLAGTINGNPAQLLVQDPLRPSWMTFNPLFNGFQLGFLTFESEGNAWRILPDTPNISFLIISGPSGFAPVAISTTTVAVPEFPAAGLTAIGLAVLICAATIRQRRALL